MIKISVTGVTLRRLCNHIYPRRRGSLATHDAVACMHVASLSSDECSVRCPFGGVVATGVDGCLCVWDVSITREDTFVHSQDDAEVLQCFRMNH